MKNKSKKTINTKQLFVGTLVVFMLAIGITKADAEILTGTVADKRRSNSLMEVLIRVNLNRPFDHIISLGAMDVSSSVGAGLNMIIEPGSRIRFDDEGMGSGNFVRYVGEHRIIDVDGLFVLDMFPGMEGYFKYAARAKARGLVLGNNRTKERELAQHARRAKEQSIAIILQRKREYISL